MVAVVFFFFHVGMDGGGDVEGVVGDDCANLMPSWCSRTVAATEPMLMVRCRCSVLVTIFSQALFKMKNTVVSSHPGIDLMRSYRKAFKVGLGGFRCGLPSCQGRMPLT